MRRFLLWPALFLSSCGQPAVDPEAVARGKIRFETCASCHLVTREHLVGPGLAGIVGRPAGQAEGFAYSDALKKAGFNWTEDRLVAFLSQENYLPGANMVITPLPKQDAEDIVAFLSTLE